MVARWPLVAFSCLPLLAWSDVPEGVDARATRLVEAMDIGTIAAMGLHKSIETMRRQGMTEAQAECVRGVTGSTYVPVLAQVAAQELSAAEIEAAIRFYESPGGRKYVVMTEVKSAEMIGLRSEKTIPDFTPEEIEATEQFGATPVFQKLVNENVLTRSVTGRNRIQDLTMKILKRCGAGK